MRDQRRRVATAMVLGVAVILGATVPPARPADLTTADCPAAPALLYLRVDDPNELCVSAGELIHVTLSMACLQQPVSGYQAFLLFDADRLAFVSGSYALPEPFGIPLVYPIVADGNRIDLAAGINPLMGQQPTTADADLAQLTFEVLDRPGTTRVWFRDHQPPTTLSGEAGGIEPALGDTPVILLADCPYCRLGDLDCDDQADGDDWLLLAACLTGPEVYQPPPGCDPVLFALSDLDADADVDMGDVAVLQTAAGP